MRALVQPHLERRINGPRTHAAVQQEHVRWGTSQ